jgi:hypothetical protein
VCMCVCMCVRVCVRVCVLCLCTSACGKTAAEVLRFGQGWASCDMQHCAQRAYIHLQVGS